MVGGKQPAEHLARQHHPGPVRLLPRGPRPAAQRRSPRAAGTGHRLRRRVSGRGVRRPGLPGDRVDPSAVSIGTARAHAATRGLDIDYRVGTGEQLPAPDSAFGLAYCCDVLEHVPDPDRVISETARVLKPGGLYLFDTINRTRKSKLLAIKVMQQWPLTRVVDAAIHDWDMFIK